jgi:hypothetical protein
MTLGGHLWGKLVTNSGLERTDVIIFLKHKTHLIEQMIEGKQNTN